MDPRRTSGTKRGSAISPIRSSDSTTAARGPPTARRWHVPHESNRCGPTTDSEAETPVHHLHTEDDDEEVRVQDDESRRPVILPSDGEQPDDGERPDPDSEDERFDRGSAERPGVHAVVRVPRSEERRVGKECSSRW